MTSGRVHCYVCNRHVGTTTIARNVALLNRRAMKYRDGRAWGMRGADYLCVACTRVVVRVCASTDSGGVTVNARS